MKWWSLSDIVCLCILTVATVGGCEYSASIPYAELEFVEIPIYSHLHQLIGLNEIYVWVSDGQDRIMPPDQYQITLSKSNGDTTVLSPRDGFNVPIPIDVQLMREGTEINIKWSGHNSKVILHNGAPFSVSAVRSRHGLVEGGLKTVWPVDMKRLEGEGFSVYYEEGGEAVAEEMFELMASLHQTIRGVLGVEPIPFGLAMVKTRANYSTPDWPAGVPVFSFPQAYDLETESHPIVTVAHEWTEQTLRKRLVSDDPGLRFVFDGLAELVAEINAEQWYFRSLKTLESLAQANVEEVNVPAVFPDISPITKTLLNDKAAITAYQTLAGYPLSHLFWRRVADQHGISVIKEIVRRWRAQGSLDTDGLIDLVAEVTADPSVRGAIEHANVQDAITEYRRRGWVSETLEDYIYLYMADKQTFRVSSKTKGNR